MNTKVTKGKLPLIILLIFLGSVVLFLLGHTSDKLTKKVSAENYSCLGSLEFEEIEFISSSNKSIASNEEFQSKNFSFTITDSEFIDEFHKVEFKNPQYNFFDAAFEVIDGKTYAVLNSASNGTVYDETNSLDLSSYRTRKALRVFDGSGNDTGFVIYCCVDDLGDTDVFLASFVSNESSGEYAADVIKISKNPSKKASLSELNLSGSYSVSEIGYTTSLELAEKIDEKILKQMKFDFSEKSFSVSGEEEIDNPSFSSKTNAFESQGKKTYAVMYYVGEKLNFKTGFDVTSFKETTAWNILDENGEETNYVLYFLTDESNQTELYIAHFIQSDGKPPYSQYLLKLQKEA